MADLTPEADWAAAFVAAQAEWPVIPKNKTANAGTYKYAYADLPSIIDAVRPVLAKHGLGFTQAVVEGPGVITRIFHSAGHSEAFGPAVVPTNGNAQAVGSAISYARRYSLCAALGIAADEDDDAQAASKPKTLSPAPQTKEEGSAGPGLRGAAPEVGALSPRPSSAGDEPIGGHVGDGEASTCPPHSLDYEAVPRGPKNDLLPCLRCEKWVKDVAA